MTKLTTTLKSLLGDLTGRSGRIPRWLAWFVLFAGTFCAGNVVLQIYIAIYHRH